MKQLKCHIIFSFVGGVLFIKRGYRIKSSLFLGPHGATSGFGSAFTGQQGHENSGPGFWTGLGTGGILGYLFGSNR